MKRIIMTLIGAAFAINGNAHKETTTTIVVPGRATSVTHGLNGVVTVNCEESIFECYKQTTTTIDFGGVQKIKPGSQVILDIHEENGVYHHIEGGFVNLEEEVLPDGIRYSYTLSQN